MTIAQLDFYFPFYVFGYGFLVTLILNQSFLMEFADERFPPSLIGQLRMHRGLALTCLLVGGLWSLQNIWLS